MTKKKLVALVVLAVFVLLGVVLGMVAKQKTISGGDALEVRPEPKSGTIAIPFEDYYSPSFPKEAVLTPTKKEAPASANGGLDTKSRFFDLSATRSGFSPEIITVKAGDTVYIDFVAIDEDYDLDIPYLGNYFTRVEKGKTKQLPFDVRTSGTFVFQCRDYCPSSGPIKGSLVVLP